MRKPALAIATLFLLAAPNARADGPPQVGVLQGFNVLGKGANHLQGDQDRILAGEPLRLAVAGTGTCELQVEVRRGDSLMFQRTVEAKLPFTYVSDFAMPPYAYKHEDFDVKVIPITTKQPQKVCVGATYTTTVNAVCRYTICNTTVGAPPKPAPPPPAPVLGGGVIAIPQVKPANGNISAISVPGGSFATDETQRIHLSGTGGCAVDLHISGKIYGGNFDKTFPVNPINLAGTANLFNGTHFDTLSEGSYTADATGKAGCSGKATIDFKVTGKTIVGGVNGKPTVKLEKQPLSGGAFTPGKDGNIWFHVNVPSDFTVVPSVSCCEVEYDYKNSYGGWEMSTESPVGDASFDPMTNNNQAAPRSVSYFKVPNEPALEWRMRVRGYRYYLFNWSDWLDFRVSP